LLLGREGHAQAGAAPDADETADIVLPAVSSTEAREYLAQRPRSATAEAWLRAHLPHAVLAHLEQSRV